MEYKVYVTLGFHINFYHSWRGDTPDEAGFGTDIRVMREVIKILDHANAAGLKARAYWDTEVYWTFQEILPKYSPDILEGLQRRVNDGLDEIVLGPFNNGANHAATAEEFRASVNWALENEWGSGLRQLFGKVAPFYRPQETMFTIGQEAILKECGVDGLLLYYAVVPFNTLSSFIPVLPDEQRYNPFWFRSRADQPPMIVLPCIAAADLIEQVSLENLMLNLHQAQVRGEIKTDVLININEDADLETWLPVGLPSWLSWFPNMGGLDEFIRVVNKYSWADFTVPSEYAASHPATAEFFVRQDLADGGFDGNYSWAEKCGSLRAWTILEQSRLATYRAEVLLKRSGMPSDPALWEGMASSFFQRLIGLTTTHFGMSTPIINEERQNRAFEILGNALKVASQVEQDAALVFRQNEGSQSQSRVTPTGGLLYEYELFLTPAERDVAPAPARIPVRMPVVLPINVKSVRIMTDLGQTPDTSLINVEALPDGRTSAQVVFIAELQPTDVCRVRIFSSAEKPTSPVTVISNEWLSMEFSEKNGIERFSFLGEQIGGLGFLDPFITYNKKVNRVAHYQLESLAGETWNGLERVRLHAQIPMQTKEGEFTSEFIYTFSLFNELPYIFVDVKVQYAYTPPRQIIHNLTQKLRRLMDLNWIEVAPFQLNPLITASTGHTLRVWKHNFLGKTAFYDLDYRNINPKNRNLDSFNHQVTAGWVAVSDGVCGLLLGENASKLSSMAFCPMRLREREGTQSVSLNPFGSYYGKQFDYSHLGGNGNGKVIMQAFSGALQPNGPSFNGETLEFSLMLAPYPGDEPSADLQSNAAAHFYPPGLVLLAAPNGVGVSSVDELLKLIVSEKSRAHLQFDRTIKPPTAFLVNPTAEAVDIVWDSPRDEVVTGFELAWRIEQESEWQFLQIGVKTRFHLADLHDGQKVHFKLRSLQTGKTSEWTNEVTCTPSAVTDSSVASMLSTVPAYTLFRIVVVSIGAAIRTLFQK